MDRAAVPLLILDVLTGRMSLAVQLSRTPAVAAAWGVEAALAGSAPQLLIRAAFGGPDDSLRQLSRRVSSAIAQGIAPSDRLATELEWLGRSATLAFPNQAFAPDEHLVRQGDYLLDAQVDLLRGDTNAVRKLFQELLPGRVPQDVPFDALYAEARLLAASGDGAGAIKSLESSLSALPRASLRRFTADIQAVALVQSIILRADLAAASGDSESAATWARAVLTLWSSADPFLQPTLDRMAKIIKARLR